MLRSIGILGNPWSQSGKKKRKVLSLEWTSEEVMDDENGESMASMEGVPLTELGEWGLEKLERCR